MKHCNPKTKYFVIFIEKLNKIRYFLSILLSKIILHEIYRSYFMNPNINNFNGMNLMKPITGPMGGTPLTSLKNMKPIPQPIFMRNTQMPMNMPQMNIPQQSNNQIHNTDQDDNISASHQ